MTRRVLLAALPASILPQTARTQSKQLQKVTINFASRTGTTWPLYIAKEAGYVPTAIELFEMFPHTRHIETLVSLERAIRSSRASSSSMP